MKIKRKIGLKGAVQLEVKHTVNSPKVFILESSRILTAFSRLIFLPVSFNVFQVSTLPSPYLSIFA